MHFWRLAINISIYIFVLCCRTSEYALKALPIANYAQKNEIDMDCAELKGGWLNFSCLDDQGSVWTR